MSSPILAGQKLPPVPPGLETMFREARENLTRGDFASAEVALRKMVAQAPENVRLLSDLAITLFRRDKFAEAEDCLKKALALAPEDSWAHSTLGIVYYAKGQHALARKFLEEGIRLNPKDSTAHNFLAINASLMGSNPQAVEELKTAIALDGGYADAYFNLALVLVIQAKPDPENARSYYERALKLGSKPDETLEKLLGWQDENGIRTVGNPLTPEIVDRVRALLLARR